MKLNCGRQDDYGAAPGLVGRDKPVRWKSHAIIIDPHPELEKI
jgi:hypothetical protein